MENWHIAALQQTQIMNMKGKDEKLILLGWFAYCLIENSNNFPDLFVDPVVFERSRNS